MREQSGEGKERERDGEILRQRGPGCAQYDGEVEQMLCTGTVLEQTRNAHRILRVNNEVRK